MISWRRPSTIPASAMAWDPAAPISEGAERRCRPIYQSERPDMHAEHAIAAGTRWYLRPEVLIEGHAAVGTCRFSFCPRVLYQVQGAGPGCPVVKATYFAAATPRRPGWSRADTWRRSDPARRLPARIPAALQRLSLHVWRGVA